MATVELKNIVKRYGSITAVHGVSLSITNNEFVVLVGPSGCGKSTILRMVAGLEDISAGELSIDGVVMNEHLPKDRNIAMVFQNYALYPHMTVFKNMAFALKLARMPRAQIDKRVHEAADILGLTELLARRPAELSGGQRQRVAMGRAIVRDPKVFLFDEPLSNLDAKLRAQMRAEIKRLHARIQNTIIYVTHDQVEAMTLADRIVVMRAGRVEQVGTPQQVFTAPANVFVAGFIGSPPMNLIAGELQGTAARRNFKTVGVTLPLTAVKLNKVQAGTAVLLGIRPQAFTLEVPPRALRSTALRAHVELAEPLGTETLLHLRVGKQLLLGRAEGNQLFKTGSAVTMHAHLNKLQLFAADTGVSLLA